jgi:hypothetical protein
MRPHARAARRDADGVEEVGEVAGRRRCPASLGAAVDDHVRVVGALGLLARALFPRIGSIAAAAEHDSAAMLRVLSATGLS